MSDEPREQTLEQSERVHAVKARGSGAQRRYGGRPATGWVTLRITDAERLLLLELAARAGAPGVMAVGLRYGLAVAQERMTETLAPAAQPTAQPTLDRLEAWLRRSSTHCYEMERFDGDWIVRLYNYDVDCAGRAPTLAGAIEAALAAVEDDEAAAELKAR